MHYILFLCNYELVLETVNRGWHATFSANQTTASEWVDRHYRGVAQQSAKLHGVTHLHSNYRYDSHCGGLLVHHSYCSLIGDDTGNGGGGSVTRYGNHVETY